MDNQDNIIYSGPPLLHATPTGSLPVQLDAHATMQMLKHSPSDVQMFSMK